MENVVILGTGIAGCTAAIYTARASLKPLMIAGPEPGGQLTLTTDVENFPAFPDGIQGPDLVLKARQQAEKFGARTKTAKVTEFEAKEGHVLLTLDNGETIETKSLIIATGASARWLDIPSETSYKGKGVHTCATCDGFFYRGKEVLVIGGGDSAMEEALVLANLASKVTIIHRRDAFRASQVMQDRVLKHDKIEVVWNAQVEEYLGDGTTIAGVKVKKTDGSSEDINADGVFLAIGHIPNTSFVKGKLDMDEAGYLTVNERLHTNVPGVFAAGDVQDKIYRQAITAAGTGCQAALEAERYLGELE